MTEDRKPHRTITCRSARQLSEAALHTWAILLIAACLALTGITLPACSSGGSSSESNATQQTSTSTDTSSDSPDTAQSEKDERQAEIDRLTSLEAAYLHTMETKDEWADGVIVDALNTLASEGAIAPLPEDFVLFSNVFEFKETDGGYDIVYLDQAAQERLTGDFALDLTDGSKVAICTERHMADTPEGRGIDIWVMHTDKDDAFNTHVYRHDEELIATPTLKPYGESKMGSFLDYTIPDEVYADSTEECRYLIAYGSCEANVLENYYAITLEAEGSIDRTDVTTIVMVVDAQTRTVLHIENIGTDIPKSSGDLMKHENYGDQLTDEAKEYMSKLLLNGLAA